MEKMPIVLVDCYNFILFGYLSMFSHESQFIIFSFNDNKCLQVLFLWSWTMNKQYQLVGQQGAQIVNQRYQAKEYVLK